MPRKAHKYHYIYKTTCNVNGRYYIGMHSTSILEDGYMGSGKRLRRSLIKHGIENHTKEILEFLDDRKSLAIRESEIVNVQSIEDPLCMNLKPGGFGGFCNDEHKSNWIKIGSKAGNEKLKNLWEDDEWSYNLKEKRKELWKDPERRDKMSKGLDWTGRNHTEETKALIREKAKERIGDKNSQFGTCWITNGIQNMKIQKGDSIPEGWSLGRKIITRSD